jgi:sugar (pentulose or hexulose) kinase
MEVLLAADLGTTAVKAMVIGAGGAVVAEASQEVALQYPEPGFVELPLDAYWRAFVGAIRRCTTELGQDASQIAALGLSVQGETLVPCGADGLPLMNAIVWLDNRAAEEARSLRNEFGDEECYARTGQVSFVPTWPAAKLLWLRRHRKEVFRATVTFALLEDFFLHRLTGSFACEPSLTCSTAYWDITGQKWWDEMLGFLGVSELQLPPVRQSGELLDPLLGSVADELGLPRSTCVCVGALDQACAAFGAGNISQGTVSENTGAALAICATVDAPTFDRERRMPLHVHAVPGKYMLHTFSTGGVVLRWFRDTFCREEMAVAERLGADAYTLLGREAETVAPGCEGLTMLPHLQGAMAPEDNPNATGVFYGATLRHAKPHFVRSIMEAIACAVRRNLEVIEDMGIEVAELRCTGGAAQSALWCQIKSDLNHRPLRTLASSQAGCVGAAALAGIGCGLFADAEDAVRRLVRDDRVFAPDASTAAAYDAAYGRYTGLYESLVARFAADARVSPG